MKKNSFIIMVTAMAFAMVMTSCQKENEKAGNATGGTEVVDTVTIDTVSPPDNNGMALAGTRWYCRVVTDLPQIAHHSVNDLIWVFETDSDVTITILAIELNGVARSDSFSYSTTYVFDGEEGYYINPEGEHSRFVYDSENETLIAIGIDDPSITLVFHRVE